ncbi:2,3-bisphosphoglycerate-independent phosphoglycerate mutase [Thermodesulfobacteriota bacterium]
MMNKPKPLILIILDGWGINPNAEGNAVFHADTPYLDALVNEYPNTRLICSGEAVGLPEGIMGNSEVGHLNIGAGRVVYQDLLRIDTAIHDGEFFKNSVLNSALTNMKKNSSTLHLIGLVSDGGVHSQLTHLFALLDLARKTGVNKTYIHALLDGRDTPPDSGAIYLEQLQAYIREIDYGNIVSICGRYYAMDRDNRWDRVEKAYRLFTLGEGTPANDPVEAVKEAYLREETDEFVKPIVITGADAEPLGTVRDGDGIIFFNFRADRVREITRAFTSSAFDSFERDPLPKLCDFVCMTMYDESFTLPAAFPPVHLDDILGEVISRRGLRQLRIAETEKYAHVTYFFNGGEENPFSKEDRCLIPSPREVPTYDLKPEMSAYAVAEEVVTRIHSGAYDLIVLNFANMDMVGHTGVMEAAIKACETVDRCVKDIVTVVRELGGVAMVTADHGNAERMLDEGGHVQTAHTLSPVPLILVDDSRKEAVLSTGALADIAPTILQIMEIDQPEKMTGKSLLED